ncbi:MAG: amidase, partial [Burkholderiales bacterium]|nr:amidase [Burkholderiales bacterium]
MSAELAYTSATELVQRYRAKQLSPVEVTQAVLARIGELNPKLNAYCRVDEAGALAAARASEARWMKSAPLGPVDGVPASIKDLILTRDWPTLRGSKTVDPAGPWLEDGPATARLRENGAVLLGKTCTPEFGWKGVTDSALTGVTRNPWNLERTPGGSSGGASAQVAAGMGQLAVGTDGGGSIRIPCSFAGISGIKAGFGRVPAWPLSPFGTVAHVGPMARSVADCALMLNVLSQPDARDWTALPYANIDWTQGLDAGVKGLRIAYSPRLGYVKHVDAEVEARVADAVKVLSGLGAQVEEVDPGFADCRDVFSVHWMSGAYNLLRNMPQEKFALLDAGLQQACVTGSQYT